MRNPYAEPDILSLVTFYNSPAGDLCLDNLSKPLTSMLSLGAMHPLLCLGYGAPLLARLGIDCHKVTLTTPEQQGWLRSADITTTPVNPLGLPFDRESYRLILALHWLEFTSDSKRALEEIYRLLKPGGRALIILPHSFYAGFWRDDDPFSKGKSWLIPELKRRSHQAGFFVRQVASCHHLAGRSRWVQGFIPGSLLIGELEKRMPAPASDLSLIRTRSTPALAS